MSTGYIKSKDGTRIAYETTGSGPALILLHGGGQTRKDWEKHGWVERLEDRFTVIAVDMRGSGESDILYEINDYAINKLEDDICAAADACHAGNFHIIGYSFGGSIACYLAARSGRVKSIITIGVQLFGPAVDEAFDKYISEFLEKWGPFVKKFHKGELTGKRRAKLKNQIPVWYSCFQAVPDWPDVYFNDIKCPSFVLSGTKNKTVTNWYNRLNQQEKDRLNIKFFEGFSHAQEFAEIDTVFPFISSFLNRQLLSGE